MAMHSSNLSLLPFNTRKNSTHSSVGGAGLEGPAPSAIVGKSGEEEEEVGEEGCEKEKTLSLSLKSEEKKNVRGREETEEHLDDDDEEKPSLFTFSFFPALVRSAEEPSVRRAASVLLFVPSSW